MSNALEIAKGLMAQANKPGTTEPGTQVALAGGNVPATVYSSTEVTNLLRKTHERISADGGWIAAYSGINDEGGESRCIQGWFDKLCEELGYDHSVKREAKKCIQAAMQRRSVLLAAPKQEGMAYQQYNDSTSQSNISDLVLIAVTISLDGSRALRTNLGASLKRAW